jgi:argininosuccinate lyase
MVDAMDTWKTSISILSAMLLKTEFKAEEINRSLNSGFLVATDIADSLTRQGIPFRESHEIVGKMVKYCENKLCGFEDLNKDDLVTIDARFASIELPDLSMMGCVRARTTFGGTAPSEVARQIMAGKNWMNAVRNG